MPTAEEAATLLAPLTLRDAFADLPSIEAPPPRAFGGNRQSSNPLAPTLTLTLFLLP